MVAFIFLLNIVLSNSSVMDSETIAVCDLTKLKLRVLEVLRENKEYRNVEEVTIRVPDELKGQHYGSQSFYIHCKSADSLTNLFLKTYSANSICRKMMISMQLMEKESSFFNDFLPFAKLFANQRGHKMLDFFPQCLYAGKDMILLENLVADKGYRMLSPLEFNNVFTLKMVLTNLAELHAVTYAMVKEHGLASFRNKWSVIALETPKRKRFMESLSLTSPHLCLEILKQNRDTDTQAAAAFLTDYVKSVPGRLAKIVERSSQSKFVALGHGDCWANNLLFIVDAETGKAVKNVMLDFQCTRLASPIIDISYFLFTSISSSTRKASVQDLLQHYFSEVSEKMELLHVPCPVTYEEFLAEYKDFCEFGFIMSLFFLSSVAVLKGEDGFNVVEIDEHAQEVQAFHDALPEWLLHNAEMASTIAKEITNVVDEYIEIICPKMPF